MSSTKVQDKKLTQKQAQQFVDKEVDKRVAEKILGHLSTGSRPWNESTYHDTTVQDQQLSKIFEVLSSDIDELKGHECGFETVGGRIRNSYARSRSQLRNNRVTGQWIGMALAHKDEIESAIFDEDGKVRDDAKTRVGIIFGVETVFLAGAIQFENRVGSDEDKAQCEQLSRMTSSGRLNGRFKELASSMKIFKTFTPNDRSEGQQANQPIDLHPDFILKMDKAFKYFNPEVFTTRPNPLPEVVTPDKVKMVKIASPKDVLSPKGVCYWQSVPEDQLAETFSYKMIIPVYDKDGQKVSVDATPKDADKDAPRVFKFKTRTITLTEANFKLHRENNTAPKTAKNGTVSNPEHQAETPKVESTSSEE